MEVEKVRGEEEATARKEHKRAANIEDAKRRFATGFVMLFEVVEGRTQAKRPGGI